MCYDLWFNHDVDLLPVVVDPLQKVTEMRGRYDLDMQLPTDFDGEVAAEYSRTEETPHGLTGIADTYVIEEEGVVRYEDVSEHPADRTHGNWVRYFHTQRLRGPFQRLTSSRSSFGLSAPEAYSISR